MRDDDGRDLAQEERIARVLGRRPRDTRIPPFAVVEARLRRRSPLPWMASTGVVVVLLALVVGSALGERRATAPATTAGASPTASRASTATPHASPSPPATPSPAVSILSDRFGLVWVDESLGLRVRPETGRGGFEVAALPYGFSSCSCAVSPDGTRIAYWTSRMRGSVELRVVDVASAARQSTIYTAPNDRLISAAAWSSDGGGILFSLEGISAPGTPVGNPPNTALLVIDAAGGMPRVLAEGDGVYVPLGWDRVAAVAAAGISGEGGYMTSYLTVRTTGDAAPRRTPMAETIGMFSVDVSVDQRFVLGLFSGPSGSTLRWWRLADFGTIQSGPRVDNAVRATWRPFTSEIGWVEAGVLQLFEVESGDRRTGGSFPGLDYALTTFRRDGSAAIGGSGSTAVLLEIASGRSERIASAGSYIAGSVRFASTASR